MKDIEGKGEQYSLVLEALLEKKNKRFAFLSSSESGDA